MVVPHLAEQSAAMSQVIPPGIRDPSACPRRGTVVLPGSLESCISRRSFVSSVVLALLALVAVTPGHAEVSVESLYDFRHATDPQDNANNFPVVELKAFFPVSFGSFLMKQEIDLDGAKHNASQVYSEISQSIKLGDLTFQDRPLYAHIGYSGGLGLFGNATGGFSIPNAYIGGLEYPFEVRKAFCNVYVAVRDTNLARPSYGPMLALYAEKHFVNDEVLVAHSLEAWTTPSDQGVTSNRSQGGTLASWELESEVWYKVAPNVSLGTYIRTTRNVYALSNRWVVYPSVGVRYAFR